MVRSAMRGAGSGAWSCLALAWTMVGCGPRIDAEHCLFQGGDRGCDEGEGCWVVVGGGEVPGARKGCVDAANEDALDPQAHLHLRYGLPATLRAEGDVLASDSVEGVLARETAAGGLDEVCSAAEGLSSLEGRPELDVVFAARARLDGLRAEKKIRDEQAFLDPMEAIAVRQFVESIDEWRLTCEGMLPSTSSTGGSSSSSDDTTSTSTTGDTSGSSSSSGSTTGEPTSTGASSESTTGEPPLPTGYGDCANNDPVLVCLPDELCINDGFGNAACFEQGCASAGDCAVAATGDAPPACDELNGDGIYDCYLDCSLGQTCPDGMLCMLDFVCLWPTM